MKNSIISTDKAKCRDCYRCVRVCPVKAIRISEGQARVDAERCVICGTCVRECPQQAKHVRNDLERLKEFLASKDIKIASIAPSFPAAFGDYGGGLLPAALKKIGFDMVTETAVGAELIAFETAEILKGRKSAWVTSACPVVVNLVERYFPEVCEHITPLVSPMVAHARYLKSKYGEDAKVCFIGPCSAKKGEAEDDPEHSVDIVVTFEELHQALAEAKINKNALQPVTFDDLRPKNAQLFPLEGGLAKTASIASDMLREDFVTLSGSKHVREMIDHLGDNSPIRLFEALFCPGGCINGPCLGPARDTFARRSKVLQYHKRKTYAAEKEFEVASAPKINLSQAITPDKIVQPKFSEDAIKAVLAETGKYTADDELNCGACGYSTCRENAMAVLSGMAERSMCLPWMRQVAERKTDQIIDYSPNGIVAVDGELNIVSFNLAFARMFSATDKLIGRPISVLIDPEDFEKVQAEVVRRINGKTVSFPQYNLIAAESIYRLEGENVFIGIYTNITKTKEDEDRIARMRAETLASAESVIGKQMRMAQEIASILGETTSETRVLLRKLTDITRDADDQQEIK
ncbi:MAG: [Fe-Fe] hydrogenase large subunit C-terminal domain-containing protein [Armatimonadota bacterium]